ncbi:siderophore-interacting protein [Streptomyces sp. H10-C2]|uniref:siderophore-interacting protein n=1 Tax=unclassified Streptomyces TaxID=2593676 RepID=UPI0024B88036|nr:MULTISPECIES: siderophore-interacting protein [unclassified Streptomyces]MDJ0347192.1 siderophore-interacting protein [Streptomyces sp. PH10-H1]MDJ0370335.1 siderophore-interacting protein [Streptomyces sp. H10-C2]
MQQALPVRFTQVIEARRITPHMARITFGGDDLTDFTYDAPDLQAKLCFPRPGQAVPRLPAPAEDGDVMRWYQAYLAIPEPGRPWLRGHTIRAHHPRRTAIDIDFVLHDAAGPDATTAGGTAGGPAMRWARAAEPGDTLGMVGPSPVYARPLGASDWLLLAGDETALPSIGTLLESLPEGARAVAYIEVGDAAEEQRFETRGEVTVHWVHRNGPPAGHSDLLVETVAVGLPVSRPAPPQACPCRPLPSRPLRRPGRPAGTGRSTGSARCAPPPVWRDQDWRTAWSWHLRRAS